MVFVCVFHGRVRLYFVCLSVFIFFLCLSVFGRPGDFAFVPLFNVSLSVPGLVNLF